MSRFPLSPSPRPNPKCFHTHWTDHVVQIALETGDAFRATFRVNSHNRLEAYCTVDGIPIDVLINGAVAQNRAVEGDVVAIVLDPVASWSRLKGSNAYNTSTVTSGNSDMQGIDGNTRDKSQADSVHYAPQNSMRSTENDYASQNGINVQALEKICAILSSQPSKRPTGRVVSIIKRSYRRDRVVGFLSIQEGNSGCDVQERHDHGQLSRSLSSCVILIPNDSRFPDMVVNIASLPADIKEQVDDGNLALQLNLFAAQIYDWSEDSVMPEAYITQTLGRRGEVESQISAILFENAICRSEFSSEAVSCLPDVHWTIPKEEIGSRKDLRHHCVFTIDPSSATDLDDALSVEELHDNIYRVGVHVADVSYFVLPDTALDTEAQVRSTSVYMQQNKLSMLPPVLSEELGSLKPGVDRLTFSVMWDMNPSGDIIDQWIGHSVIRSCCKLSYECAQEMIDGATDSDPLIASGALFPPLHGQFEWRNVVWSVKTLYEISKRLKESRLKDGALWLDNPKVSFLFDECGTPYDSIFGERKDSHFLVEEFMLLANKTVARTISRSFPQCALLRRHPEPNLRKLKEFKTFCNKHGFELDTTSSRQLNISLTKIKKTLINDPTLFDVLVNNCSKSMQLAVYFCSGDLVGREDEWAHYSLAVSVYTHFTSPLRRYPDIIVHRTLSTVLDAEKSYLQQSMLLPKKNARVEAGTRYFTGLIFNKHAFESKEAREAFSAAVVKHKVPGTAALSEITAHCNERKLASRRAEEAGLKVYLWAFLRNKEILIAEARVMGLGPKFMTVYIHKLAMERRIYYTEVEDLIVEWLENTSTLVLDLFRSNKRAQKRGGFSRLYPLKDVALVSNPFDTPKREGNSKVAQKYSSTAALCPDGTTRSCEIRPAVFPLTVTLLSVIPVALHAVGGDDGPVDVASRLYMCSYFR